jgi:hypothetical protein
MCPAGSPCGTCQAPPLAMCVTKANCPKGWDCYDPCPCPTMPNAQTYCYHPSRVSIVQRAPRLRGLRARGRGPNLYAPERRGHSFDSRRNLGEADDAQPQRRRR